MGYSKTLTKQQVQTTQITCPTQVLVLDRLNGPAEILMDTVSRLVVKQVTVTSLEDSRQVVKQLDHQSYDLLVIGVETSEDLSFLPFIRVQYPDLTVVVVSYHMRPQDRACAQHFKVQEILELPMRAMKMKALASYLSEKYL